jgi:hypothetical protein
MKIAGKLNAETEKQNALAVIVGFNVSTLRFAGDHPIDYPAERGLR